MSFFGDDRPDPEPELDRANEISRKAKAEGRDVNRKEVREIERLMEKREKRIAQGGTQNKGCLESLFG